MSVPHHGGAPVPHGTAAWFELVGTLMVDAAERAGLAADVNVSLVERYRDGAGVGAGLVEGLRFEIVAGRASFRVGVAPHERGDITIEVTRAASRRLNTTFGGDPAFQRVLDDALRSGELTIEGDLRRLGSWFDGVHDRIVERTALDDAEPA